MKKKNPPASLLDPKELSKFFTGPEVFHPGFGSPEIRRAAEIFCRAAESLKARLPEGPGMGRGGNIAGDGISWIVEEILGEMASVGLDLRRAAILEKNERRGEDASRRALKEAQILMAKIEAFSPDHKKGDAKNEA